MCITLVFVSIGIWKRKRKYDRKSSCSTVREVNIVDPRSCPYERSKTWNDAFDKAVDGMVDISGAEALGGYKLPKKKTTRELARWKARAPWEGLEKPYVSNDCHQVVWIHLWESARRVHFLHKEGDVICAKFLDEEMWEKVIVARARSSMFITLVERHLSLGVSCDEQRSMRWPSRIAMGEREEKWGRGQPSGGHGRRERRQGIKSIKYPAYYLSDNFK